MAETNPPQPMDVAGEGLLYAGYMVDIPILGSIQVLECRNLPVSVGARYPFLDETKVQPGTIFY